MRINENEKTLYLLRGVSGSGKTTLAMTLQSSLPDCFTYAADDFFYEEDGTYNFNVKELPLAHRWCQSSIEVCMNAAVLNIIVHNTNTTEKEIQPYLDLAEKYKYKVVNLIVENRHGSSNVHNVPEKTLERQKQRLMQNIKL